ncbi:MULTISPECIES: RadC family protein [Mogibacterium]|uniref:RadC family protein n=1 Tax=Mogibacterium TaxID=86331 RepID=UPI002579A7E2|nr:MULTISPECIES: DNA repair protein RadC [Mogibacterium]
MNIVNSNLYKLPQEKLLYSGTSALTDVELLALILRTGTADRKVLELARDVMAYADNLSQELCNVDVRELLNINGIGVSKACSIVASMELARRVREPSTASGITIRTASDVAELFMKRMRGEKREHVQMFLLNSKCNVESEYTVSIGALNSAELNPREVYSVAIRRSAAAIILAHNHPSGDPEPSNVDIISTRRIEAAGELVGIKLLDHVIVGYERYVSLRAEGYIEQE